MYTSHRRKWLIIVRKIPLCVSNYDNEVKFGQQRTNSLARRRRLGAAVNEVSVHRARLLAYLDG